MSEIEIGIFNASNQRPINQFYRKHSKSVSCNATDLIAQARSNNELVGIGFIRQTTETEQNERFSLLRSLYVAESYRNQGTGTKLVKLLCAHFNGELHTICETDLIHYYELFGFRQTKINSNMPQAWKKEIKKGLILMIRP